MSTKAFVSHPFSKVIFHLTGVEIYILDTEKCFFMVWGRDFSSVFGEFAYFLMFSFGNSNNRLENCFIFMEIKLYEYVIFL